MHPYKMVHFNQLIIIMFFFFFKLYLIVYVHNNVMGIPESNTRSNCMLHTLV